MSQTVYTNARPMFAGLNSSGPAAPVHPKTCTCPVCVGLQTFVRPRFFAGQLLTDAELTALTQYVIDKQRLHNVHLHGWGVVCGLQVECDGCGPGVLVRPGYAIDPCGSDIVVPGAVSVDVLSLIQQCQVSERAPDCDPPRWPKAQGCPDEETWCLTVRYREQASRPVVPLGGTAVGTCGCGRSCGGSGCGCGGRGSPAGSAMGTGARAGWECGCSSGSSRSTNTCGCTAAPPPSNRPADCEPSRAYELYDFGVCRSDGSCHDLGEQLEGTFPAKVFACIKEIQPVVSKRMTPPMQKSAGSLLFGGSVGLRDDSGRQAVCTLYQNVVDLYRKDPMRTQCVLPQQLDDIDCSPQEDGESDTHYQQRLVAALQTMVILVLLYLRDCVCYNILPPCPDAPCDDRVVLACLTVKDGVVTSICNQDCRRYAGSFVSRQYWLPIGPVLSWLAGLVCCFPLLDLRPRLGIAGFTGRVAAFATGARYERLRAVIRQDDFAVVRLWRTRLGQLRRKYRLGPMMDRVEANLQAHAEDVPLATYVGRPAQDAYDSLHGLGVEVDRVEVPDDFQVPIHDVVPGVPRGHTATLYVHDGIVVGVSSHAGNRTVQDDAAQDAEKAAGPKKAAPRKPRGPA